MSLFFEKTVYFVRHGESEANVASVFQGSDSPLTELGIRQAEQIAQRAAHISFEALIVSPLVRTRQTARAIMHKTGKVAEYSDLFIERVKPTSLLGKPNDLESVSEVAKQWKESLFTPGMRVEDGENFDDIMARAEAALDFLDKKSEQRLLVVTHGFFLRTLVARVVLGGALSPASLRSFHERVASIQNTGMCVLNQASVEGVKEWRLSIYNDHAHLG